MGPESLGVALDAGGLFFLVAVAGNAVGGTVFVALLKYSHAHVQP